MRRLVSIQVPWPGPAVGGLMARPMKCVIHQRAQTHAQDIQVTSLYEGKWVIAFIYYLSRGIAGAQKVDAKEKLKVKRSS